MPIAAIVLWLLDLYQYLTLNTGYLGVYLSTEYGLAPYYRVVAQLTSVGGIFLTIAALLSIIALVRRKWFYYPTIALLLVPSITEFTPTPPEYSGLPGIGLNPLLKSPWAVPHPFAVLGGYALLVAAFLESHFNGELRLTELSWVLLTVGLAVGAYWSYTTFGWGGYWAWDPIETGILITWSFITIQLHLNRYGPKRAGLSMALSSMLLTMGMNYAGVSPLHSFAGPSTIGYILAISSLVAVIYGLYDLLRLRISGDALSIGMFIATISLMAASLYIYFTLLMPILGFLVGFRLPIPAYDSAIAIYYPVLLPCILALMIGMGTAGFSRTRRGLAASLSWGAASLAISTILVDLGVSWSPLSSSMVNTYIIAYISILPMALWGTVKLFKQRLGLGITHLGLLLLIISVALSGPYAYNSLYFNLAVLEPGLTTIVPLPYVGHVNLEVRSVEVYVTNSLISLPPPLVERYVPSGLAEYLVYLDAVNNLLRNKLKPIVVPTDNGDYLFLSGNLSEGKYEIGQWVLTVNSTRRMGHETFVVGFMSAQGFEIRFPSKLTDIAKLALLTNHCAPVPLLNNEVIERIYLSVNGRNSQATYRFDAAGVIRGIGGSVPGVAIINSWLDNYYVVVSPYSGGNLTEPIALLLRDNVDSCNVVGSWILANAVTGSQSPSTLLESISNLRNKVLVLVKYVPMVNLVWLSIALMVTGVVIEFITRARNASVFR